MIASNDAYNTKGRRVSPVYHHHQRGLSLISPKLITFNFSTRFYSKYSSKKYVTELNVTNFQSKYSTSYQLLGEVNKTRNRMLHIFLVTNKYIFVSKKNRTEQSIPFVTLVHVTTSPIALPALLLLNYKYLLEWAGARPKNFIHIQERAMEGFSTTGS